MPKQTNRFYAFGPFRVDIAERLLLRDGKSIPLTSKVFDTLLLLIQNKGEPLEKQELLRNIWPDTFVDEGNLFQNISILRKALGDNIGEHRYIETLPKRGYRFVAEVVESEAGGAPKGRRRMRIAAVVAVAIAGAAGLWLAKPGNDVKRPSADVSGSNRDSIAVAALVPVPLTSYPGLEWFPSFSPDGNQVAFQRGYRGGRIEICVQLVGATQPLCLTEGIAPAWSPDGRSLAFARVGPKDSVLLLSPLGGSERKLAEFQSISRVTWHPNGSGLVVAGADSLGESESLFWLTLESGEKRRLTSAPVGFFDVDPAVSPDGKALVFGRGSGISDIALYLLDISEGLNSKGEPRQITFEGAFSKQAAWRPDGRSIVFISGTSDNPGLYEMSLSAPGWVPGKPTRLAFAGQGIRSPAISRQGRLAYSISSPNANIWRLELSGAGRAPSPKVLIASTLCEHDQEYSPDGKRIAFASNRSGSHEIWVCESNGSSLMQLTSLGTSCYTTGPHWSPDGRLILFRSNLGGHVDTYYIAVDGGKPELLFSNSTVDSWSSDSRWIYLLPTGADHLSKRPWPPSGHDGDSVQSTPEGAYLARESPDGKILYYLKNKQELWKVPVKGGKEAQVLKSFCCEDFAVVDQGIYFMSGSPPVGYPSIKFLSFATGKTATIATLSGPTWVGFSVAADGRSLLYSQQQPREGDIWMVENFR